MSYKRASDILPNELISILQEYIQGELIYIPKKEKLHWGTKTNSKTELNKRNREIYQAYLKGYSTLDLAKNYYLSQKTIQKIIRNMK